MYKYHRGYKKITLKDKVIKLIKKLTTKKEYITSIL